MPDRYGRPTMQDGLQIAQTVQYFRNENIKSADRKTEKESFEVFDAMQGKRDTSGFGSEARFKGAKMYWDQNLTELQSKTQEQRLSTAGMQEKITKLKLNLETAGEKLRLYRAARAAGEDSTARRIAVNINNEHMYNGRFLEESGQGYKLINSDGGEEYLDSLSIAPEEIDRLLGAYFDKPYDEIMSWQMSGEENRAQKNAEILSKAEPYINDAGNIIYRIPGGTWGPDGKPRGAFFVSDPSAEKELSPEEAQGYVKFDVEKGRLDIKGKKKTLNKPDIVTPGSLVTSGGKAAAVVSEGGGLKVQPVQGDVDTSSLPGKKGASSKFNESVKRLDTELMPFMDKGQSALDPETLTFTNDGRNALTNALKLKQKHEKDPDSLSPEEQAIVNNAIRAVQIYQSISEGNRQKFGLEKNPAKKRQESAPLPPGFKLDQ